MKDQSKVKIFISYVNEDSDRVKSIADDLRQLGFNPWMAEWLPAGQREWEEQIQKEIDECDFFMVFLSSAFFSVNSTYCLREVGKATHINSERYGNHDNSVYIIPVLLDDIDINTKTIEMTWHKINKFNAIRWIEKYAINKIEHDINHEISQRRIREKIKRNNAPDFSVAKKNENKPPVFYTCVIAIAIIVTLFAFIDYNSNIHQENRFLFKRLPVKNHVTVWEIGVLLTTLCLLSIYAISELFPNKKRYGQELKISNLFTILSVLAVCIAFYSLLNSESIDFYYVSVLCISIFYLCNDILQYRNSENGSLNRKHYRNFVYLLDTPILISLVFIIGYYYMPYKNEILYENLEFFMGGAIAFQLFASNVIFLTMSWIHWSDALSNEEYHE